ncbi:MAG: isopentenyl diphosphate isomerase/L-lactate dehydrogenase-like FMN-dependent dehydrogenase [Candidatus Latescibacterota bacterium]|jgi:isopentenyl diphosphate isomerase/L-lactate dehydrogenase-like FMN-dependent dehydrogenase
MARQNKQITDALTTEDLWTLMRQRVPPIVSEYFRGGADAETTLRGNVRAFQQAMTTAYGALSFPSIDLSTTTVGHSLDVPWYISPVGSLRSLYPMGDAVASQVAGEFGTVMTLSTLSGTPMEAVTEASKGNCWYQLYLCGGRETALRSIARAKQAGFTALVLTMDTGVSGLRILHAKMKPMQAMGPFRGLSLKERLVLAVRKLMLGPQMLSHLPWLMSYYRDGGLMQFVNVIDGQGQPMPYADIGTQLAASAVTWDDLKWIKEAWGDDKPLIIKGVHCAHDARKAEEMGATGVIWSNHGGRQQDRVPPTLHIVAQEMPLVGDTQLDFMMDGGVRNGTDVLIALSYGLKAVGIGRVTAAGIGAGGPAGLTRTFEIMKADLDRAMRLVGVQSVAELHTRGAEVRRESQLHGDGHLPPIVF